MFQIYFIFINNIAMEKLTYEDYDEIYDLIRENDDKINDSSVKAYTHCITKTLKDLDADTSIFEDYDKVYEGLSDSDNLNTTIRNKVNAIIKYLKSIEGDKELIEKYSMWSDGLGARIARQNYKMEKSEKELDNWATLDELKERLEELKLQVPKIIKTYHDIATYQRYIGGLIQLHTGLRNEIADCEIYEYSDYNKIETSNDVNYLVVKNRSKESKLIIQNYKTKKTYGVIEADFDEYDTKEIKDYLRESTRFKEKHKLPGHWLIYDKHGDKLTRNEYTKFLQSVFKIEDKKISSTMIRKILLSTHYDAKAMEDKARSMCHSLTTQFTHYIKK